LGESGVERRAGEVVRWTEEDTRRGRSWLGRVGDGEVSVGEDREGRVALVVVERGDGEAEE
jgi:hypothetical protein